MFGYNNQEDIPGKKELLKAIQYWGEFKIDSTEQELQKAKRIFQETGNKKGEITALNYLSRLLYIFNPQKEIEKYTKKAIAINLSLNNQFPKRLAASYYYLGNYYSLNGQFYDADSLMQMCIRLREKHLNSDNLYLAYAYFSMAEIKTSLGFFEESRKFVEKTKAIYLHPNNKRIDLVADCEVQLSRYYAKKNDYITQHKYLKSALLKYEASGFEEKSSNLIFLEIGQVMRALGNYKTSISYYQKGLEAMKTFYGKDHDELGNFYLEISNSYFKLNNLNEAFLYAREAERIFELYPMGQRINRADNFSHLGILYLSKGELTMSENYFKKAHQAYGDHPVGSMKRAMGLNYYNFGDLYAHEKKIKKAVQAYNNGIKLNREYLGLNNTFTTKGYNRLLKLFIDNNMFSEAENILILALKSQINVKNKFDFNIDSLSIDKFNVTLKLINTLSLRQRYLKHKLGTNSTKTYSQFVANFELALNTIFVLRNKNLTYESKLLMTKNINQIIAIVIGSTIKAPVNIYRRKAFNAAEIYKAGILLESLNHSQARNFASLPDSLRDKERDLKIDITFYNNKLNEENSKQNPDSARVTYYENVLFDFNRDYEALIDTLENKYPDYYDLKHRNYVASVDDVQKELLDNNSALVEYYYSDSAMYAFAITKNEYEVYELGVPKHFKQWLSNFRKAQTDARFLLDSAATANQLYFSSGNALFKHLLQPVLADLDSGITNLIIVPDGELGHINFETLLTDSVGSSSGSYADLPYLLKDYNIQYAYSATVLLSAKRHKRKAPATFFAGFAPNYANLATTVAGDSSADQMVVELTRSGNYQLPGAISEVENLAALTGGDAFINTAASERAFKQNADRYQVLHLAMHGLVNDRDAMYSKLLFTQTDDTLEDNYLNAAEIFNLDLSADLVVLSACNTGYGQVNRGEGIMSLSRAFKYAGSPSLIMSLWQIPDQPTSAIMNRFYENLMAGQRKDVALRNAKLDFLSANRGNLRSHPFYWAGLIPIGDMQPLAVESWAERNMLLLAGLLLLLIIAVLVSRRMRDANKT
jgi:CHAT domain-containing protein